MTVKICRDCGVEKDISHYGSKADSKDGRNVRCKPCNVARTMKYYHSNREKVRESNLKRKYGINAKEFTEILTAQQFVCAICEESLDVVGGKHAVDHNHATGEVRGVLCKPCNQALGLFKDNPSVLNKAAEYLRERGSYGTSI